MVNIPLILKLKKHVHKEIARVQDIVREDLYKIFDKAVLHGGTAIWRCYNGNRFSEDIDVYIPRDIQKIDALFKNLKERGFIILKKKVGRNSLFSNLKLDNIIVRLEALFKKVNGVLKEYEAIDGNMSTIYTLLPEEMIREKVNTYLKRKKIRDLYDIFFLLRYADKEKVKKELNILIGRFDNPIDEKDLQNLIIEGIVPNTKEMLEYIKRGL